MGHRNAMIFLKQMASAFLNVSDGCGPVFLSASSFCWLFLGSPLGSLGVTPPKMQCGVEVDPLVQLMKVEKTPDSTYEMIGGVDKQIKVQFCLAVDVVWTRFESESEDFTSLKFSTYDNIYI